MNRDPILGTFCLFQTQRICHWRRWGDQSWFGGMLSWHVYCVNHIRSFALPIILKSQVFKAEDSVLSPLYHNILQGSLYIPLIILNNGWTKNSQPPSLQTGYSHTNQVGAKSLRSEPSMWHATGREGFEIKSPFECGLERQIGFG